MRIIGFAFEKISAEKEKTKEKNIKINSNIEVKSISQDKIENLNEEVIKIEFEFKIDYQPNLAKIVFLGYLLITTDKSQAKEIIKKWKSKKISDELRIPLFNFILTKCNIKALQLEEDLSLPSHVPMPRITPQQNRSYTG